MKPKKFMFFLIPLLAISFPLRAEDSSMVVRDVSQKLLILETKIDRLTSSQNQIVQKHADIQKELDNLRIWIRRNRS